MLRAQTAAYNLNFTLSGLFWLGAEFQKLCQAQLLESRTGESCVPQPTVLIPRRVPHWVWTKSFSAGKTLLLPTTFSSS